MKQPATLMKENLTRQPPFKVRRKPVPRLSDLPSSPTPTPRKNAFGKDIFTSFPALDSGSIGHHYQLDPQTLDSSGELRIHNLIVKKLLGIGGQGRVYLAQGPSQGTKGTGPRDQMVFAVKVMFKSRHVHYDDILREQKLMRRLRGNRFLLQLEASFHDKKNFYLITVSKFLIRLCHVLAWSTWQEYHSGGDLEDLLRVQGYFSISAARIYTAELVGVFFFVGVIRNW